MTVRELRKYLREGASIMLTDIDETPIFDLSPAHLLKPAGAEDEFDDFTVVRFETCRYGLIIYCAKDKYYEIRKTDKAFR